jgi:uncharacterized protein YdaU (DUF1376 family)
VAGVGPWYPRYASRFAASTAAWSLEATGAYDRLLDHQWDNAFIPDDVDGVAAILRVGRAVAKRLWWIVEGKFPVTAAGQRRNPVLADLRREREEYLAEQARKGKAGADARWHGRGDGNGDSPGHSRGNGYGSGRKDGSSSSLPSGSPLDPEPSEGLPKASKRRTPAGALGSPAERPEIPVELSAAITGFAEMWAERMRCAGRKRPNPGAEGKQLAALAKALREHGKDCVIAAVEEATRGGWSGIFPKPQRIGGVKPALSRVNSQASDEDREKRAKRIQVHG